MSKSIIFLNHALNKLNSIDFTTLSSMLMSIKESKGTAVLMIIFVENRRRLLFAQTS